MHYSRILVHVDSQSGCRHRLEAIAALARQHAAQVFAIAGPEDHEINTWTPFSSTRDNQEKRAIVNTALERFSEYGKQAYPLEPVGMATEGGMVEAICRHARFVDLVVLGQPDHALTSQRSTYEGLHQIALRCPRPVLFVPCAPARLELDQTVMIGWNGSREASRAIADALPLLKRAARVVAVSVNPPASAYVEAQVAGMTLAGYLESHGIKSEAMLIQGADQEAGKHLIAAAQELGAGLLVAGVRHTPAVNDWMLQGASSDLIRETRTSLFMSH